MNLNSCLQRSRPRPAKGKHVSSPRLGVEAGPVGANWQLRICDVQVQLSAVGHRLRILRRSVRVSPGRVKGRALAPGGGPGPGGPVGPGVGFTGTLRLLTGTVTRDSGCQWALIESRASSLPLGVTGPALRPPPHDPSLAANWEVLRLLQVRKYLFQVT